MATSTFILVPGRRTSRPSRPKAWPRTRGASPWRRTAGRTSCPTTSARRARATWSFTARSTAAWCVRSAERSSKSGSTVLRLRPTTFAASASRRGATSTGSIRAADRKRAGDGRNHKSRGCGLFGEKESLENERIKNVKRMNPFNKQIFL